MLTRRRFLIGSSAALTSVVLARRLLGRGGSGGGFVVPPYSFAMTTAPAGGWIWFTDPRAVTYNGVVYHGYVRGDNGNACIGTYVEATRAAGAETTLATLGIDDHNGPALLVRASDHKLLAYYSVHDGPTMFVRVSTNSLDTDPSLSGGFAAAVSLPGGPDNTYPVPIELSTGIYLFRRDIISSPTQRLVYHRSTDGVTSWDAQVHVFSQTGRSSYWKIAQNGTARIDFVTTDGHPAVDAAPSTYHFALDAGAWVKSDGSSAGALPLDTSRLTLVASGASTMTWIEDAAVDSAGRPYAVWIRYATAVSDLRYMWGRWTGSAWDVHEMAAAGASISGTAGSNYYSGGIALDKSNPNVVYASLATGTEMWRYQTTDDGATWISERLFPTAVGKQIRPVCPVNAANIRCLWMSGTYSTYLSYSVGTSATRR